MISGCIQSQSPRHTQNQTMRTFPELKHQIKQRVHCPGRSCVDPLTINGQDLRSSNDICPFIINGQTLRSANETCQPAHLHSCSLKPLRNPLRTLDWGVWAFEHKLPIPLGMGGAIHNNIDNLSPPQFSVFRVWFCQRLVDNLFLFGNDGNSEGWREDMGSGMRLLRGTRKNRNQMSQGEGRAWEAPSQSLS